MNKDIEQTDNKEEIAKQTKIPKHYSTFPLEFSLSPSLARSHRKHLHSRDKIIVIFLHSLVSCSFVGFCAEKCQQTMDVGAVLPLRNFKKWQKGGFCFFFGKSAAKEDLLKIGYTSIILF